MTGQALNHQPISESFNYGHCWYVLRAKCYQSCHHQFQMILIMIIINSSNHNPMSRRSQHNSRICSRPCDLLNSPRMCLNKEHASIMEREWLSAHFSHQWWADLIRIRWDVGSHSCAPIQAIILIDTRAAIISHDIDWDYLMAIMSSWDTQLFRIDWDGFTLKLVIITLLRTLLS